MKEHYNQPIEPVAVQEQILTQAGALPTLQRHFAATAVKYLMRAGLKPGQSWQQELTKAVDYLHRAVHGVWAGVQHPQAYPQIAPVPGVTGVWCLHHEGSLRFVEASTKEEAQAQVKEGQPRLVAVTPFCAEDAQKLFESVQEARRERRMRPWRVTWAGGSVVVDADCLALALAAARISKPSGVDYAAKPVTAADVAHLDHRAQRMRPWVVHHEAQDITVVDAFSREHAVDTLVETGAGREGLDARPLTALEHQERVRKAVRPLRPWVVSNQQQDIGVVDAVDEDAALMAAGVSGPGYEARPLLAADYLRAPPDNLRVRLHYDAPIEQQDARWRHQEYEARAYSGANAAKGTVRVHVSKSGERIAAFSVDIADWQEQAESIATAVVLADMGRVS